MHYPDNAGFAMGDDKSPDYFMMEVHYDNPQLLSGRKDNSGELIVHNQRYANIVGFKRDGCCGKSNKSVYLLHLVSLLAFSDESIGFDIYKFNSFKAAFKVC